MGRYWTKSREYYRAKEDKAVMIIATANLVLFIILLILM